MRPRTLLVLLVIVLGLGAFIWFYERELPSSEQRAELEKRVLTDVEKDDVTAVTLQGAKGTVRLERVEAPTPATEEKEEEEDGDEAGEETPEVEWRIVQPLTARADTFAVDRLLDSVITLEKTRTIEDADRKAVGLDKPRATVRLATKEAEKVLQLGAGVPTGGSIIAGVEGRDDAYVVSESILLELDKDPGEWRDRTIFRGDRDKVSRITLAGANGRVVLAKRPDGLWIEAPLKDRADRNLVDALLSDLTGLTAERFVDNPGPLPELGLAPAQQVVEVALEGQAAPLRIELGAPATSGEAAPEGEMGGALAYARAGGTVFETRTRLAESANRPPAEWRALGLSGLEVHDVEAATVKEGNATIELTRAGTDWKRGDTTISYLPVSDLLFAVTDARAERLLPPAEAKTLNLANHALVITLKTKEAGEETLSLYPAMSQGVPARASGREAVLLLPAEALQQIRQKLKDVREAKAVAAAAE
ncbi:MAG TPA: DUF4340 domain-containing protein [Thermoanaerobaculia bacterium]|nr:DUF4340 domain-containing protein [Thermoanaerobaculia bacterium]